MEDNSHTDTQKSDDSGRIYKIKDISTRRLVQITINYLCDAQKMYHNYIELRIDPQINKQ